MITENGLLFGQKSKQPFEELNQERFPKKLYFGFSKSKNDTLRHSIPYCYLLEYCLLFLISLVKKTAAMMFFQSKKNSKWYLVAFGMIGTALSGDFISVPGEVGAKWRTI
jgi:hypothetical protein